MAAQTETYTPLTDAELALMDSIAGMTTDDVVPRAAAEIRALRASEARLLAALKEARQCFHIRTAYNKPSIRAMNEAQGIIGKAIAAAEGRAEG